ncbi:hypothetical protein JB92DRAFT_3001658 [Gautieria morchelliformis]|nr:hypothetical protein JB92DRAFT_3001658 [Gautieria morchelliformis]
MKTTNGTRLKGIVKELSQAQEDYQEARNKGWLTGLLEQFRQDGMSLSSNMIGATLFRTFWTLIRDNSWIIKGFSNLRIAQCFPSI